MKKFLIAMTACGVFVSCIYAGGHSNNNGNVVPSSGIRLRSYAVAPPANVLRAPGCSSSTIYGGAALSAPTNCGCDNGGVVDPGVVPEAALSSSYSSNVQFAPSMNYTPGYSVQRSVMGYAGGVNYAPSASFNVQRQVVNQYSSHSRAFSPGVIQYAPANIVRQVQRQVVHAPVQYTQSVNVVRQVVRQPIVFRERVVVRNVQSPVVNNIVRAPLFRPLLFPALFPRAAAFRASLESGRSFSLRAPFFRLNVH